MGSSGTGKTCIALGLIFEAIKQGYRACFVTVEELINIIRLKEVTIQDDNSKASIGIYMFYVTVFDINGNVKKYKKKLECWQRSYNEILN